MTALPIRRITCSFARRRDRSPSVSDHPELARWHKVLNRGHSAPNWFRECRDAMPDHDESGSDREAGVAIRHLILRNSCVSPGSKRSTTR
jgi:hypothetical protein